MHARTTFFEIQKSNTSTGIDHVFKTVMPAMEHIDGYVGMSLHVDGTRYQTSPPYPPPRCLAYSFWESAQKMQASANAVKPLRDRTVEVFGGSSAEVDEWEISFLNDIQRKATKDTISIASWHKVDPSEVDSVADRFKEFILSQMGGPRGSDFRSSNTAVNRASGRTLFLFSYDLSGKPERAEDQVKQITDATGLTPGEGAAEGMWFFDFGLGHFWVP